MAFRILPPQDDPDVRRLVGDSPGWRVLYREPPGMRTAGSVLFGLLAVAALFIASVPALRTGTRYLRAPEGLHEQMLGSFAVGVGASAFLIIGLVAFALRARALDRAHEGVVRGVIQSLDVIRSSRFAQYLANVNGTVVSLLPEIHSGLAVGHEAVIERDRQGSVRFVLIRDGG